MRKMPVFSESVVTLVLPATMQRFPEQGASNTLSENSICDKFIRLSNTDLCFWFTCI